MNVGGVLRRRATWIAIGLLADRLVPELPNRWHPVAWFGSLMGLVERTIWSDRRSAGTLYALFGTMVGLGAGRLIRNPAVAVGIASAGPELRRLGGEIEAAVRSNGVDAGRAALRGLVGRDTSQLDEAGIAAAVVESVAENTVDAVVAPVFWGLIGGASGALAYRAINTMDAMVGRRNARYERFGKVAARLDDVANFVPARLFALAVMFVRPRRASQIVAMVRRDASAHPSPNAGVAETSAAAALGVELGGPLHYGPVSEDRPRLGSGPRPSLTEIEKMNALSNQVELLVIGVLTVGVFAAGGIGHQHGGRRRTL
ncbi:cobalamin biosynthesis protein [Ilumatobacter sp.]|uniref:cobalamin biosynthesis protein CobD/CbiB n=1 Tax=Ilumatobacter sp. TaxID=1967498 RepID=UPI0037514C1F